MSKYDEIMEEFILGELLLTSNQIKSRDSRLSRGQAHYGCLKSKYPYHYVSFRGMHNRSRNSGRIVDFDRSLKGFIEFIVYLGPVPNGMINPSIGRKDHSLGYVKDNFEWQSGSDNVSEANSRHGNSRIMIHRDNKRLAFENWCKSNPGIHHVKVISTATGYKPRSVVAFVHKYPYLSFDKYTTRENNLILISEREDNV